MRGFEGRWSKLQPGELGETVRKAALVEQLLERHGVLAREAVESEGIVGGFAAIYGVLRAMEEAGKLRRGYFVEGLGATQFALRGAEERLRGLREREEERPIPLVLAATDPANPYGAAIPWPEKEGRRLERAAGAQVILHEGRLLAFLGRTSKTLLTFLPSEEPERSRQVALLARQVVEVEAEVQGEGNIGNRHLIRHWRASALGGNLLGCLAIPGLLQVTGKECHYASELEHTGGPIGVVPGLHGCIAGPLSIRR